MSWRGHRGRITSKKAANQLCKQRADPKARSAQTRTIRAGHRSNALSATRQDDGIVTSVKHSHPRKAFPSITRIDDGMATEANEPHEMNVAQPIDVTECGIVTDVSESHP
jgi:hypothetical protein